MGMSTAANGFAAYYVQEALETAKDELEKEDSDWMRDPQEAEVVHAVRQDERMNAYFREQTAWNRLPHWLHLVLVIGLILSSAAFYLMIQPVARPFQKFGVADKISSLP